MHALGGSARRLLAAALVLIVAGGLPAVANARLDRSDRGPVGPTLPAAQERQSCDPANAAWIGTFGYGLDCLDQAGWHPFVAGATPLPSDLILDIEACPNGRTWVAHAGGVSVTNGRSWNSYGSDEGISSPDGIACDGGGGVWVAHYEGVSHFDGKHWTRYPSTLLGSGEHVSLVRDVVVAEDGLVWVATADSVASFDGTVWSVYEEGQGLDESYSFSALAAAPSGLWAAHSGGVLQFDGTEWLAHSGPDISLVEAVTADPDGDVWVGTFAHGVSMYDGLGWQLYDRATADLPHDMVRSLDADDQGRIWAGTGHGLAVLDGDTWQARHMHDSQLLDDEAYAVGVSGAGPELPGLLDKAPGTLSGALTDAGAPAGGLSLELCSEAPRMYGFDASPCEAHILSAQATAGPDGRFTFEGVPVGRYGLVARSADGEWLDLAESLDIWSRAIVVEEGAETDLGPIDLAKAD